jgi:DNA/RNA endonuclease G (NUC1)
MKKLPLLYLLILTCVTLHAQIIKTDTIVNMGIYKSYYNNNIKEPLYVTYYLYKGGGNCDREAEHFNFKSCGINTATDADYATNGYDKGHLANAEDFANDCNNEEKTFCYFNCVPQTLKLNRGVWKTWETKARELSQTTKLFIIAGNIYGSKTIGDNHIGVPEYCYKIIIDAKTKKTRYCLLFPNDDSKTVTPITLVELKKKLGYKLVP